MGNCQVRFCGGYILKSIDLSKQTYTRLFRITLFLKKVIATDGYKVLFVGTQKSIAPIIAEIANKTYSDYVNERWKGGFLTNYKTMKKSEKAPAAHLSKNQLQTNPESSQELIKNGDSSPLSNQMKQTNNDNRRNFNNKYEIQIRENQSNLQKNPQFRESNELSSLPDLVIIVGQQKELKAIKECQKLNIPMITILDSDGDPSLTSLFIPANDDSRLSVEFILSHIGQSILVGRLLYENKMTMNKKAS